MTLGIQATFCLRWLIVFASLVALLNLKIDSALGSHRVVAARIAVVENGLDSPVVIAGEPTKKWTIGMQMGRLYVPAVSVAVINDYKIDWARA